MARLLLPASLLLFIADCIPDSQYLSDLSTIEVQAICVQVELIDTQQM